MTRGASVAGCILLVVCVARCSDRAEQVAASPPPRVEVLEVSPTEVPDASEYVGTLISRRSVVLRPQVTGYVRGIAVRPGEQVERGDVLFEIDAREERAALDSAEAAYRRALSELQYARQTRQRSAQLLREGIVSRQDDEEAEAALRAAEAGVRAAQAEVEGTRVRLTFTRVRAPFDGTVGDVPVKLGDSVTPQTDLTRLDQSELLELSIRVPVERVGQVELGETPVEILGPDGEVIVEARPFFLAPSPDPVTQLVELKAAFANTAGLRTDQRVRARVVFDTREALTIPSWAVTRLSGQAFAFVVTSGDGGPPRVHRRPVELGPMTDEGWVVEKGLQPGERVAISRIQSLSDGQAIHPVRAREREVQGEDAGVGVGGSGAPE
ncbi:MAG: efflux RND transporter periplasmic adaptor subunit [Myxococcaceae bacterium]